MQKESKVLFCPFFWKFLVRLFFAAGSVGSFLGMLGGFAIRSLFRLVSVVNKTLRLLTGNSYFDSGKRKERVKKLAGNLAVRTTSKRNQKQRRFAFKITREWLLHSEERLTKLQRGNKGLDFFLLFGYRIQTYRTGKKQIHPIERGKLFFESTSFL